MNTLNETMQNLFNTVTKSGTINDSYVKRITRFDALFDSIESKEDGFLLTDINNVSFDVTKYQLLGLVLENPTKLDSYAIRKGGVDNTMLSYSVAAAKQVQTEESPLSLLINIIKQHNKDEICLLQVQQQTAMLSIESLLANIANGGTLKINNTIVDVSSVVSLLNLEKYKEQLNKFQGCFNPIKSDKESLETGSSKQLQVVLFDSEVIDNKIIALYKSNDDDSKTIINSRLTNLGFKGIKWSGKTSLSVDLS